MSAVPAARQEANGDETSRNAWILLSRLRARDDSLQMTHPAPLLRARIPVFVRALSCEANSPYHLTSGLTAAAAFGCVLSPSERRGNPEGR